MLQYDFGINYFINNYIGINIKEVYYLILEIIKNYGLIDIWIDIYEKFENKIEFNDELKKMYEYVKKNNEFLSKVL
ncbi:MAG: hypothetical protein RSF67_06580 [Clostridia bacterium]